jgi:hypothetical protein
MRLFDRDIRRPALEEPEDGKTEQYLEVYRKVSKAEGKEARRA